MKAYLITVLSLHALSFLVTLYWLGVGRYPRTRTTTAGEAVFIGMPITLVFMAWEAWLLFGGSL